MIKNCAQLASEVVMERGKTYGSPVVNHTITAELWSAYLRDKLKVDLTPDDVCALMILQKLSRHKNGYHSDNQTDICGYALNQQIVNEPIILSQYNQDQGFEDKLIVDDVEVLVKGISQ
jgi:hypothetical protein